MFFNTRSFEKLKKSISNYFYKQVSPPIKKGISTVSVELLCTSEKRGPTLKGDDSVAVVFLCVLFFGRERIYAALEDSDVEHKKNRWSSKKRKKKKRELGLVLLVLVERDGLAVS